MIKEKKHKDLWKPVRDGDKYCSPACGMGCTYAEYLATVNNANFAAEMAGKGWKTDIWENLGWHYQIIDKTGHLKVTVDTSGISYLYHAYLGDKDSAGGYWVASNRSFTKAIEEVYQQAKDQILRLAKAANIEIKIIDK